jgi:hypothetical protein
MPRNDVFSQFSKVGRNGSVSGWGGLAPYSDLRFIDVTIQDKNFCEICAGIFSFNDSHICTIASSNSIYEGDNGGPLTYRDVFANPPYQYYEMGVLSYSKFF